MNAQPKSILVADDDPVVIRTIFQCFKQMNGKYDLLNASNGQAAYEITLSEKPNLLLLDWDMPLMNGLEVVRHLKQVPSTQNIPVIMITGKFTSERALKEAFDIGVTDYLRKPFNQVELLARTESTLRFYELHKREKQALQQIIDGKNRELSSMVTQIIQRNQLLEGIQQKIDPLTAQHQTLVQVSKTIHQALEIDNHWERFKLLFEEVHPLFFKHLQRLSADLTPHELKLCAYIKMQLGNKEIAQVLNISIRGLETARYRLRKKLKLTNKQNLNTFILQI
ncbi:hypothetical protein BKI52_00035 [marine bacterium AO1-C]|nr:hypothetical protein BKI52_00035 [marine bacterium AO1-C]